MAPSPRWKGAAAHWCQPAKPLVSGPSRNPRVWQQLSHERPKQMGISVDSIGLTQDGMCHFPLVVVGSTTWRDAHLGTRSAGSPGAGPTASDRCEVTLRLPADAHRKAAAVNNLGFAHAIFLSLPISSLRSHFRPMTRRLGVGLFLLTSSVGAGTGGTHAIPPPWGHVYTHSPRASLFRRASSLQGVQRP